MKYWTQRLSGPNQPNKHALKVTQLKLELGLFGANLALPNDKVAIEITGIARKKGKPSSSYSSSSCYTIISKPKTTKGLSTHTTSSRRFLGAKTPSFVWDASDLCGFHLVLKDGSFASLDLAFHVLYGREGGGGESKTKMAVVGEVSSIIFPMEELKTESNSHLQRRLQIKLKVNGFCIEATLSVSLKLLNLTNSHDESPRPFENTVESKKKQGIISKVMCLTRLTKKNDVNMFDQVEQPSPYDSDGSPVFDSDDSSNESSASSGSSSSGRIDVGGSRVVHIGSERFTSSETKTPLEIVQRSWSHLSWNRSLKGWSFKSTTTKQETSTTPSGPFMKLDELSPQPHVQHNNNLGATCGWKFKEISSRDGQAKLKTNVFFASFDQRSEQASGESACTVLVALIAHWLHSNKNMPTRAQFNSLITQGSYEWRKLCNNAYYLNLFPDKHFDLETIIEANLRPLIVVPQKSYTGFFSPEKFHCLKGAMSFDEIWNEINNNNNVINEARVYIVSWNDHFFVLKVEGESYYIIDSLGERLYEGCQQAFILKFDDSSVMYGKVEKANEITPSKGNIGSKSAKCDERLEIVCRGKECCKEFIKRFLAAIPVWQLEKEEKKGKVSNPYLHRQLQIEFHYSTSSSSSSFSTSETTSLSSLFSSGPSLEV